MQQGDCKQGMLDRGLVAPTQPSGPEPLDQLRQALRSRHYSRRTEQTYCHWVKRFIYFHDVWHAEHPGTSWA